MPQSKSSQTEGRNMPDGSAHIDLADVPLLDLPKPQRLLEAEQAYRELIERESRLRAQITELREHQRPGVSIDSAIMKIAAEMKELTPQLREAREGIEHEREPWTRATELAALPHRVAHMALLKRQLVELDHRLAKLNEVEGMLQRSHSQQALLRWDGDIEHLKWRLNRFCRED